MLFAVCILFEEQFRATGSNNMVAVMVWTSVYLNCSLNSSPPGDAYMHQWIGSVLVQIHSTETHSTVDPQWNILYWGSKWNLHTVCWSAVGCEWGTTSVYFGITYVCYILSRHPVYTVEPQYQHRDFFSFLWKVPFEGHIQYLKKNPCWFKILTGFVGQILIKLTTSSIWGFLVACVMSS